MRTRWQRSLLGSVVLAAAVLCVTATAASPAGQIVIQGNDSGSHLTLTVNDQNLVVSGYLDPGEQVGCTKNPKGATCPLSGVDSIEVNMGPNNDKVEVQDPLPIPLTTYLGSGSDKLIANDEPDTCYPQGDRRNRCLGGGGDDICITGPRNSDCVGDAGDDYCKHSSGSDGCWGGSGDDVCIMGSGKDGCHGDAGNDKLYGGPDPDQLYGGAGRDYCNGQAGVGRSHECELGPGD